MTTPSHDGPVPNATIAAPVAAATWQTASVEPHSVHQALERLWAQVGAERGPEPGDGGHEPGESTLMRASTVNLIVLCDTVAAAKAIGETIGQLTEFCPSRAVILVTHGAQQREDELTVRAAVHERFVGKRHPPIRYETITVTANSQRASSLANIASTLLVPELPDFLWWQTDVVDGHPLFDELSDICDRLIVDTTLLDCTAGTFRLLSRIIASRRADIRLSDLTWARLTPWRQLVAQFFDASESLPCLSAMDQVEIEFGRLSPDGPAGLPSALLMAGWIASRLEWRAPGELVNTRHGQRVTLRAGKKGAQREIMLHLTPTDDAASRGSLRLIRLSAEDNAPGTFTIERVEPNSLMTKGQVGDAPAVSRMVYARSQDPTTLLSDELRLFGRDTVFEEALAFAAGLLSDREPI